MKKRDDIYFAIADSDMTQLQKHALFCINKYTDESGFCLKTLREICFRSWIPNADFYREIRKLVSSKFLIAPTICNGYSEFLNSKIRINLNKLGGENMKEIK